MNDHVYLGIKKYVVCLDKRTGEEIWRTKVKTSQLITLIVDGPLIIAHAGGELFGIARRDRRIMWNNGLTGLGYGYCQMASEGASSSSMHSNHAAIAKAKKHSSPS
jgi:outer membrane protein assembly factor BamB